MIVVDAPRIIDITNSTALWPEMLHRLVDKPLLAFAIRAFLMLRAMKIAASYVITLARVNPISLLLALVNLVVALKWGRRAGPNPWGSRSFEWITSSPPSKHNFDVTPIIERTPYDYHLSEEDARERSRAS